MASTPSRAPRWELFLLSFLALHYELVVIRWLASEVRVFAYFKNLPLLASFLGLGVGCALAGRRPRLAARLPLLLGANGIVARWRPGDVRPWFGLLWASLALAYFVPAAALTGLPFAARATVGALMVCLPILFAGVISARALADVSLPSAALGSNLFGALVGGTLEYLSMLLGIRALSLLALALYVGAFLALRGLRQHIKL